MTDKTENLCECGFTKEMHTKEGLDKVGFTKTEYAKETMGICKRFKAKKIGILELAKRIKDEDRELVKLKNQNPKEFLSGIHQSQEKKDNNNGLSGVRNMKRGTEHMPLNVDNHPDTQTLFDKVREMKQGDIVYHTLAYFEKEDVRSAVLKLKEELDEVIPLKYIEIKDAKIDVIFGGELSNG